MNTKIEEIKNNLVAAADSLDKAGEPMQARDVRSAFAVIAGLIAAQGRKPIYQVEQDDGDWCDSPKEFYDLMDPSRRRIVHLANDDGMDFFQEDTAVSVALSTNSFSQIAKAMLADLQFEFENWACLVGFKPEIVALRNERAYIDKNLSNYWHIWRGCAVACHSGKGMPCSWLEEIQDIERSNSCTDQPNLLGKGENIIQRVVSKYL